MYIDKYAPSAYNITMDSVRRARTGAIVSLAGIACNVALAAAKITVGLLFGLVSVIADGFNNLSDCGSSVVSLVSFRIAEKPADREHPYGHRRAEYVASMIIGFIVLFLAAELVRESVEKIIGGSIFEGTYIVYAVLGVSVAIKAAMFVFYRAYAKKLQADTLRASAIDSACDCIATLAVLAGVLISHYANLPADGWAGVAVALFIAWQGGLILKEAGSKLLGQAPDVQLINSIHMRLLSGEGVLGVHDLRVYPFGREKYFATAHVEMDGNIPSLEAHSVLDGLEHSVAEEFGVELTCHLDPVDLSDTEARELEEKVRTLALQICEGLELHDFRLIRGKRAKIIFDIAVPFSCKKTDSQLHAELENCVHGVGEYDTVITIDRI